MLDSTAAAGASQITLLA